MFVDDWYIFVLPSMIQIPQERKYMHLCSVYHWILNHHWQFLEWIQCLRYVYNEFLTYKYKLFLMLPSTPTLYPTLRDYLLYAFSTQLINILPAFVFCSLNTTFSPFTMTCFKSKVSTPTCSVFPQPLHSFALSSKMCLERLFSPHWIFFGLLSKINWLLICELFTSVFRLYFVLCIYIPVSQSNITTSWYCSLMEILYF